jgi:hypothetical protein
MSTAQSSTLMTTNTSNGMSCALQETFFDLNAKTPDGMKRDLRQYCNAHPLANYMDGVLELLKSLPLAKR